MVVHGKRLVLDLDAEPFQTVAELQVLVAVAGETLVEAACAEQIVASHGCVAGKKIKPRKFSSRRRMQMPARIGMISLVLVLFKIANLNLQSDDGNAGSFPMTPQMRREEIGRRENVGVVEKNDCRARPRDARVTSRCPAAIRSRQVKDIPMRLRDPGKKLGRAV